MSTKTYDQALDFMPTATTGGRGPLGTARQFFSAITEGFEAQARYQRNLSRGMGASEAAGKAFDETSAKR